MPSVRFSRDKRGYEYVYLVHTPVRRGKPGRTRVLYWYRTPPGVRIGRKPFDEEVQRTLEQQNPGVTFDWDTIINTPMPPPDMTEFWRERRRAEKAARQERRAMEAEAVGPEETSAPDPTGTDDVAPGEPDDEEVVSAAGGLETAPGEVGPAPPVEQSADGSGSPRKRRRRRGGRRRRPQGSEAGAPTVPGSAEAVSESAEAASNERDEPSADGDPTSEEE